MLIAVSMIGVLLHVVMDLPTTYGTRLLSPFDWHWFAVDWMPIVDIYLLMALVIGLLGRPTPAQRRAKAAFVLLLMATNYGVRAAAHHQALDVAPRLFGPTLPPPCDRRRRDAGGRLVAASRRAPRIRRPASAVSSKSWRCRRSRRRSHGASSRRCRTPTRSTTSTCSISVSRPGRRIGRAVAADAALSERVDARGRCRRRRRTSARCSSGSPASRRAIGGRSPAAPRRCAGPTCGSPAARSRSISRRRASRRSPRPFAPAPTGGSSKRLGGR